MTALDRVFALMDERAPMAVDAVIQAGASNLYMDDRLFWSRVRRICGEDFVGKDLIDVRRECNRIRDIEIRRGQISHWTYDQFRHVTAIQLCAAISQRQARDVQVMKYGRSHV